MNKINELANLANLDDVEKKIMSDSPEFMNIVLKIAKMYDSETTKNNFAAKAYESYKDSPYLKNSAQEISCFARIDRNFIVENEFGKRIEEMHGTMFYFKERTKEFAHIAGLDADEMRMAYGEGIQNILEHGKGKYVEVEVSVHNINSENVYLQMSFKHYMPSMEFYSILEANKNADEGILNFESSRGRGEYLMREIMDERKFINGIQKRPGGEKEYFFQRIMRKYRNPHPKAHVGYMTDEFKNYIDSLQDYHSALFVRMDYFSKKKELVISEDTGNIDKVKELMKKYNYSLIGSDNYRNINFSFWVTDIKPEESDKKFDEILNELEVIIAGSK